MDTNNLQINSSLNKNYISEYHRLSVNLQHFGNWAKIEANKILDAFDLTHQQFNALCILQEQIGVKRDTSFSTNNLRDLLLDKMSDTSRLVDRLLIKELIHKKPCDMDGRRVHITITEKGIQLLSSIDLKMNVQTGVSEKITEIEAEKLNKLLEKLR